MCMGLGGHDFVFVCGVLGRSVLMNRGELDLGQGSKKERMAWVKAGVGAVKEERNALCLFFFLPSSLKEIGF